MSACILNPAACLSWIYVRDTDRKALRYFLEQSIGKTVYSIRTRGISRTSLTWLILAASVIFLMLVLVNVSEELLWSNLFLGIGGTLFLVFIVPCWLLAESSDATYTFVRSDSPAIERDSLYGEEFLSGVTEKSLLKKPVYTKSYKPTFDAIRKSGKSVLPYDIVSFDLDAPVSNREVKDKSFLTDPAVFTVTKATTVVWTKDGQTGTIQDADITDIKALPEDAEISFQPDDGSALDGTSVSVADYLKTYQTNE